MFNVTRHRTAALLLLGLAACLGLTAFVYWAGLYGPFMLDDGPNIERAFVPDPDWDAIVYTITHNGSGRFGRSVSMLSFVLTSLQYGLNPFGYKLHNLLLHLANGVLLWRLLQVLLPRLDARLSERRVMLIAAGTAALWLLHPLLVSTVLYAVQRMAMLSTFFTLLALLAYLKARTCIGTAHFYLYGWVLLPLATVLAVLSKESGALIPLYLLAVELCAFRTGLRELRHDRRLGLFLAAFIALPLLAALTLLALNFDSITDYSMRTFTLKERVLTQIHVLFFYLRLILLPRLRDMSLFHDDFPVTSQLDVVTMLLLAALIGLLALAWTLRRTQPVVAFGILLFFASHLLESTFVPLELVFEHRNYLASAGVLLLPVYGLLRLDGYRALGLLCPVFIAMFAFMTATRAAEWGDRDLYFQMTVLEHPRSPRARNNYVNYLMSENRYADTLKQLEELIDMTPTDAGAFLHMQVAKCARGERDAEALARAAELAGEHVLLVYGHSGLQVLTVLVVEGRCGDVTVDDLEPIVSAAFAYAERNRAFDNLDNLYRVRAMIAMKRGQYAQGYSDFRVAHEITGRADVLHELLKYQVAAGLFADAEDTLGLLERQNAERFGIETYVVEESRSLLEDGRRKAAEAAAQPAAEVPASTPE